MDFLKMFLSGFKMTNLNIPRITFIDIIDILLVAFLIYQIVIWIKETRAWSLFKGIVVVFIFSVVAVSFKLTTILWIITNAISVGIIAIIVVFQPELRKALEQLGKGNFFSSIISSNVEDNDSFSEKQFDEMLDALKSLSAQKTGALILIEQDVPLGDHERTGIPIDAVISKQLIINIFEHNTPLHDGAVIVKNNRIAAATCFLPLTESPLSRDLGTRHRAAVGASEVSDAFVLVVSEETGHISVANSGKLHRNLKTEDVKELYSSTGTTKKKKHLLWKGRLQDGQT